MSNELEEKSEAELELLVKNLDKEMERNVNSFAVEDIALFSGSIPNSKTMLEYRSEREDFIKRIEEIGKKPKTEYYFENKINQLTVFDEHDLTSNVNLVNFFQREINVLTRFREKVLNECQNVHNLPKTEPQLVILLESISNHISKCENAIFELKSSVTASYTFDDIFILVQSNFIRRQKKLLLRTIFNTVKDFPLTRRHEIAQKTLDMIEGDLSEIGKLKLPEVKYLISESDLLDEELYRLGQKFNVHEPLSIDDGQSFLYQCEKMFSDLWNSVTSVEMKLIQVQPVGPHIFKKQEELVDIAYMKDQPIEEVIQNTWDTLANTPLTELTNIIKEFAHNYDQMVNGKYYRNLNSVLNRKKPIQPEKVTMFYKLRHLKAKYQIMSIVTHLNFFEAIKQNMHGSNFKFNKIELLQNVVGVYQDGELVLLSETNKRFAEFEKYMLTTVSFYIRTYESKVIESGRNREQIVDKQIMIEEFLDYTLEYLNAKRSLVQPLYEMFLQDRSNQKVIERIYTAIEERPILRLYQYHSFKKPFRLAIDIVSKKASLIRSLLNLQIQHVRQIDGRLPRSVPIFERSSTIPCEIKKKIFAESIPLTPFEAIPSLTSVSRILHIVDVVVDEVSEGIDMNRIKFIQYMELAVWQILAKYFLDLSRKGFLPFSIDSLEFKTEIQDGPYSVITSPYLNSFDAIVNMFEHVPESRKTRYAVGYMAFLNIGWELQDLVLKADCYQDIYLKQSTSASNTDPKIFMDPFKDVATADMIDVGDNFGSERAMNFGLIDFENPDFDFNNMKRIIHCVLLDDFGFLKRLLAAQRLHVFTLEVSIRYNFFMLDNDFLVEHFGIGDDDSADLFLTQGETTDTNDNDTFIRSFMVSVILLDTQYLLDSYKKAQEKREWFFLNIKATKAQTRLLMNAQAKQRPMNDAELFDMYIHEISDAFAASAYRLEVAFVNRLERQLLLLNSFSDAFIIDSTSLLLVNEAGRVGNHFVIHTWADTFKLVRTAPLPRQAAIFKIVLTHVVSIYKILSIIRFECSLQAPSEKILLGLLNANYKMETAVPQKLLSEFSRLPGANEFDVCARFLDDKYVYYFRRMDLATISALESAFVSVKAVDQSLPNSILLLREQLNDFSYCKQLTAEHYVPKWTTQFFAEFEEINRSELGRQMAAVDVRVDSAMESRQIHSMLESYQAVSESMDYLNLAISHLKMKFSYFLAISGNTTFTDPLTAMSRKIYFQGAQQWNSYVVNAAAKLMAPKEDMPFIFSNDPIPEDKVLNAQLEIIRNELDSILLQTQIRKLKETNEALPVLLSKTGYEVDRPDPDSIDYETAKSSEIDKMFNDDYNACRIELLQLLERAVRESKSGDLLDFPKFEEKALILSTAFDEYMTDSIKCTAFTWHNILSLWMSKCIEDEENDRVVDIYEKKMNGRFGFHLATELALKLSTQLMQISFLEDALRRRKKDIVGEDIESEQMITEEYDILLRDLNTQRNRLKAKFIDTKNYVYDTVQERIKKASNVQFVAKGGLQSEHTEEANEDSTQNIKEENVELAKRIKRLRIIRCLSSIAARRFFIKKIQAYEGDRKFECGKLWQSRRDFEVLQTQMLANLRAAYRKLAISEIEIEKMKQQLDNEKQSTIQLVHWKAMNSKRVVELNDELKKYAGVDKVDVGELLRKLNTAKETLRTLEEETQPMDVYVEREIRRPMTSIDRVRKRITATKIDRTGIIQSRATTREATIAAASSEMMQSLIEENEQIRGRNASLQAQIRSLEQVRKGMSIETISTMEDVRPSPRVQRDRTGMKRAATGKLTSTRPKTAMKQSPSEKQSRNITRPVTAINTPRKTAESRFGFR